MCQLGATDFDLADFFEVSWRTIKRWEGIHPAFNAALKRGKEAADDRVERSLYARATGYTFDSIKIFNNEGEITQVPIVEHVPPDVAACRYWLNNRRPDLWRERVEQVNVNRDDVKQLTDAELTKIIRAAGPAGGAGDAGKTNGTQGPDSVH